jgi:hypothetical protein
VALQRLAFPESRVPARELRAAREPGRQTGQGGRLAAGMCRLMRPHRSGQVVTSAQDPGRWTPAVDVTAAPTRCQHADVTAAPTRCQHADVTAAPTRCQHARAGSPGGPAAAESELVAERHPAWRERYSATAGREARSQPGCQAAGRSSLAAQDALRTRTASWRWARAATLRQERGVLHFRHRAGHQHPAAGRPPGWGLRQDATSCLGRHPQLLRSGEVAAGGEGPQA